MKCENAEPKSQEPTKEGFYWCKNCRAQIVKVKTGRGYIWVHGSKSTTLT